MAASREAIERWLKAGNEYAATHMIVKCDSFANDAECCYPVYVLKGEDARTKADENKDRTMECYSYAVPFAMQMSEHRAFHWD